MPTLLKTDTKPTLNGTVLCKTGGPPYATVSGSITTYTVQPPTLSAWNQVTFADSKASNGGAPGTDVSYQILFWNGSAWVLIPDGDLGGQTNSTGITGSVPIDISTLNAVTYPQIRVKTNLSTGDASATPRLIYLKVTWTP